MSSSPPEFAQSDLLKLHKIAVSPIYSELRDPVELQIVFSLSERNQGDLSWRVSFLLDVANDDEHLNRDSEPIEHLFAEGPPQTYSAGEPHTLTLKLDEFDISSYPRHKVMNTGILRLALCSSEKSKRLGSVDIVTQIGLKVAEDDEGEEEEEEEEKDGDQNQAVSTGDSHQAEQPLFRTFFPPI